MLFTASSRNWYSTPCSSPLPEPSSTTSMKIPQATAKPVSTVRSLLRRTVSKISCQASRRIIRPRPGRGRARARGRDAAAGSQPPPRGAPLWFDVDDDFVGIEARLSAVVGDPAVDEVDEPVGHVGDVALVGDDDHRHALLLDRLQHLHHVARGRRVERAGRLVGEQQLRRARSAPARSRPAAAGRRRAPTADAPRDRRGRRVSR